MQVSNIKNLESDFYRQIQIPEKTPNNETASKVPD
jgi:hypothetical protein